MAVGDQLLAAENRLAEGEGDAQHVVLALVDPVPAATAEELGEDVVATAAEAEFAEDVTDR